MEVVFALLWREEIADVADGLPEGFDGSNSFLSKEGFELGECHFDRVEIGAVRRQEQQPGASRLDSGFGPWALVGGEVVEDDDIALIEGRSELGLDIGFEDLAVHRAIDDEGRGEAVAAQAGDEGLGIPMTEGGLGAQALALGTAPVEPGHLCRGSGLVDEDQPMGLTPHPRLTLVGPLVARLFDVGAILFVGPQSFF